MMELRLIKEPQLKIGIWHLVQLLYILIYYYLIGKWENGKSKIRKSEKRNKKGKFINYLNLCT